VWLVPNYALQITATLVALELKDKRLYCILDNLRAESQRLLVTDRQPLCKDTMVFQQHDEVDRLPCPWRKHADGVRHGAPLMHWMPPEDGFRSYGGL
jgi:hypothetical protein